MSSENSNISDTRIGVPQDIGVDPPKSPDDPGPVTLRITSLAAGGRGVARHDGQVWFVAGALPGDLVEARVIRRRKRHVEAVRDRVLEPSKLRREPPCPIQPRCGGCPWMPLQESEQRSFKQRLFRDAFDRIGGLQAVELEPVRSTVDSLGYRNRMEFAVAWPEGELPVIGLHGSDPSSGIVSIDRCRLQSEPANSVLTSVRDLLARSGGRAGPGGGPIERVVIRRSEKNGKILVGLGGRDSQLSGIDTLAQELSARHEKIQGVVYFYSPHGRRGGTRSRVLIGESRMSESVSGLRFDLSSSSFSQVNTRAAETLLELVSEMAAPVEGLRVLDLYGGVGLYALGLMRRGADSAIVCDADVEAVRCGRETAARHRIKQVRYVHADVRRFLAGLEREAGPQRVVANPPRTGLGKGVARAIRAIAAERVILVSCDPPTLARDLAELIEGGRYVIERVVPLDLFPQTAHVEAVVCLGLASSLRAGGRRRPRPGSSRRPASG